MALFKLGERSRGTGIPLPTPPWYRRRLTIISAVVLVVAAVVVVIWQPWASQCGAGLTQIGSPYTCVGLDLDSGPMQAGDPLAPLEQRIAAQNAQLTGDFATVVVLDNMTPNLKTDSISPDEIRHRVEGAITAAWRANTQSVAYGNSPPIKLLLASFGSSAGQEAAAVQSIVAQRDSQHIVAVTGFGQSLVQTRLAAKQLSDAGIVSVGATVTADDMNTDPSGARIPDFFRVAATNSDEEQVTVNYIAAHGYHKVLLVKDVNTQDSYDTSIAADFAAAYQQRFLAPVAYNESYLSPTTPVTSDSRTAYLTNQFARMHSDICADHPDLIYFAGRGVDLGSFLTALSQGGACGLGPIDVLTADDASSIVDQPLPPFPGLSVRVFYTTQAAVNEWANQPSTSDAAQDYAAFAKAYQDNGFEAADLQEESVFVSYDAVLAAAIATRLDSPLATKDSSTVASAFLGLKCTHYVPGASGDIAFDANGNPIDKAIPMLRIMPDGSTALQQISWPTGVPFNPSSTC
ncbi:MAG TPA: amino acid ABC transporter substrate-binding protein [Pseudonocardiaceae bacterium]|jgi:hypothetical protein